MDKYPGYLGLLKWSLAQNDGTADPKDAKPLSKEDIEFLDEVMKSITVDVAKRMSEIAEVLMKPDTEGTVADKETSLEELMEHVENLDNARDLCTLGGLVPLHAMLASGHSSLRALAAEVVATACQNNPKVQHVVFNTGMLEVLFKLSQDSSHPTVQSKAVLAVSALVRECPPATHWYLTHDGVPLLATLLADGSSVRLQRRAILLVRHLMQEPSVRAWVAASVAALDGGSLLDRVSELCVSGEVDMRENAWHVALEFMLTTDAAPVDSKPDTPSTVKFITGPVAPEPAATGSSADAPAAGAGVSAGAGAGAGARVPPAALAQAPAATPLPPPSAPLPSAAARAALLRRPPHDVAAAAADRAKALLADSATATPSGPGYTDELASVQQLEKVLAVAAS